MGYTIFGGFLLISLLGYLINKSEKVDKFSEYDILKDNMSDKQYMDYITKKYKK